MAGHVPGAEGEQDGRPFLGCYQRYQHRSASLSLIGPLLRGGTKNTGYSISVAAIKNARQRIIVNGIALHRFRSKACAATPTLFIGV